MCSLSRILSFSLSLSLSFSVLSISLMTLLSLSRSRSLSLPLALSFPLPLVFLVRSLSHSLSCSLSRSLSYTLMLSRILSPGFVSLSLSLFAGAPFSLCWCAGATVALIWLFLSFLHSRLHPLYPSCPLSCAVSRTLSRCLLLYLALSASLSLPSSRTLSLAGVPVLVSGTYLGDKVCLFLAAFGTTLAAFFSGFEVQHNVQRTATHCNALHRTAIPSITLQHTCGTVCLYSRGILLYI